MEQQLDRQAEVIFMLRFFGQPKYADKELFGYELFLREKVAGNWQFPKSFSQIHGHEFS